MDTTELRLLITTKEKITSTNSLYNAGLKYVGGKPRPYIYKSQKANKFTLEVIEQLRAVDFSNYIDWLRNTKQFDITISFILKSNVTRRDVQNLDKLLIDIITKFIKEELGVESFDDSLFSSVHFYKSIIPKSEHEFICISMVESRTNLRFDKIDKPEKIYIGNIVEESVRKDIIKELKLKKIKYTDNKEKECECNAKVYILTPRSNTLLYDIGLIVNSVWECISSETGFIFIGISDIDQWSNENTKSQIENLISLIKSITSNITRVKIDYMNNIKNLF